MSLLGDFVAVFAVQTAVAFRMQGTPGDVTMIFAAGLAPALFLSPFTGALADRWDPCRAMIASDLARAVLVLFLASAGSVPRIWAVSFALGCASSFFQPALSKTVPLAVARQDLACAYARLQQGLQIARIASPAAGAALMGWLGESACYYADSASFVFSAALLAKLRIFPRAPACKAAPPSAGLCFLAADPTFSSVLLALAGATFAGSCLGALAPVYVRDTLQGTSSLLAAMSVFIGAGTLAGASAARRLFAHAQNPLTLVQGGMVTVGISALTFVKLRGAGPALAAALVMGAGAGVVVVAAATLLQGRTPAELRGRIGGISASLTSLAQLAAMLLAGVLASWIGVAGVFALSAAMLLVTALALGFDWSAKTAL